jgi:hypothetical protein
MFYLSFFGEKESVKKLNFDNDFVQDSLVYPVGTNLVFDYKVIKNGDTLKCLLRNDMPYLVASSWEFRKVDTLPKERHPFLIDHMTATVLPKKFSDRQQFIQFNYFALNGNKLTTIGTGIIEDEEKVWWHPFREFYFMGNEFSPFPSIHFPLEIGNSWEEIINVGKSTSVLEWVENFEGNILPVKSTYRIKDKRRIKTVFGDLDCFVVESTAVSPFSETKLTSYYHEKYGFVRWEYFNIDKTELVFDLVAHNRG